MGRTGSGDLRKTNRIAHLLEEEPKLVAKHLAEHMWLEAKERELLLNSLLEAPVSAGSMPALSRALMASDEAGGALGEELLDYLLSYPLTDRQAAACLDEAEELAVQEHEQLTEERRKRLLKALLKLPLPEETVPELAQVLAGQKLWKEQRRVLLDNILSEPLPPESVPELVEKLAQVKLQKDARTVLLDALLKQPVPAESVPALKQALQKREGKKDKGEPKAAPVKEKKPPVQEQQPPDDPFDGLLPAAQGVDVSVPAAEQPLLFFEGEFFADGQLTDEMELLLAIAAYVGKENILVKRHPSSTVDRFTALGFAVMEYHETPWEVLCRDMDLSGKVLVSAVPVQCLLPGRLYGKQTRAVLLHELLRGQDEALRLPDGKAFWKDAMQRLNGERITCWAPVSLRELELVLDVVGEQIGGWN